MPSRISIASAYSFALAWGGRLLMGPVGSPDTAAQSIASMVTTALSIVTQAVVIGHVTNALYRLEA